MKDIHVENSRENPSTKQSNDTQIWEQMDLFEWAGLYDESCLGFAVRNGF
jgi:hypothetical protein